MLGSGDDLAKLELVQADGEWELHYYDNRFPVAPGTAGAGDDPVAVHDRQHYELVDWRRADSELNYRRFFAINTLAGLRAEDPDVFAATHELIVRLVESGAVDALRIDHPDGLADPKGYLDRLAGATGGRWTVVEKILEPGEQLPGSWATAGTTGYDALAEVDEVLVDPAGGPALTALDTELAGRQVDYAQLVHDCKREVTDGILGSEVARLARIVGELPGVSPAELTEALAELLASFPVYRSYLPDGREHLDETVRRGPGAPARPGRRGGRAAPAAGHGRHRGGHPLRADAGPVMAKGVEDSAYYRWARFVALNEVGGDPARFGTSVAEFHAAQQVRAERLPRVDDDAVDPRHQAQRGRPGPAGRAGRAAHRVGRSWCAAGSAGTRWPTARWRTWSGRTSSAPGRCPASGRTPTWRRPPARPAPRRPGPTRSRSSRTSCTRWSTPRSTTPRRPRRSRRSSRASRRSAGRTRCRRSCCS